MPKFKAWLSAARLRTLPLSISGILVGTALANHNGFHNWQILVLALLTTVGFQITSNFANDYGDGVKGTDNADRIGPERAYQSGALSRKELKSGIFISIIINLFLIAALLLVSFGEENLFYILLFSFLGLLSIWAAIRYTVGEQAYGYQGLGDLFVFSFFGLLSVIGSQFLYAKSIVPNAIYPAITIGLLSTAVLNLNNLRDQDNDRKAGKNTLVVQLGFRNGKRYHLFLILVAFLSMLLFGLYEFEGWKDWICMLAFLPIFVHIRTVLKVKDPAFFDPELKKIALSTFLLALLIYIVFNNFL